MLVRMWRKRNPHALLVGMQMAQLLWKIVWSFLQKLKIEIPNDPVYPLSIYPKNVKTRTQKGIRTPMFIAALFTIAKLWKQPKCPSIDEWVKKMWYIYTMEYYSAIKRMKSCHMQPLGWS